MLRLYEVDSAQKGHTAAQQVKLLIASAYCRSQKSCRKTYSGHATNHPHTHTFFYKILKIIQKFQKYIYIYKKIKIHTTSTVYIYNKRKKKKEKETKTITNSRTHTT